MKKKTTFRLPVMAMRQKLIISVAILMSLVVASCKSPEDQYNKGCAYLKGDGVEQSYEKAAK